MADLPNRPGVSARLAATATFRRLRYAAAVLRIRQAPRLRALIWPLLAACACAASPAPSETSETGERECFACEAQRACMAQSCAAQVSQCWGEAYFEGENGGACESVLDCQGACACADEACIMSCFADADPQCLSCSTQVAQCEQDECSAAASCEN